MTMEEESALEKLTGSVITKAGLAAVAASIGTPLAALLPILSETLAAGRHKERVENELHRIDLILKAHRHRLDTLTDPQYKLMNEIVLAVLQNTEDKKTEYLRRAIENGLSHNELNHTISSQVSRALRDMTAGELKFVIENSEYTLMVGPFTGEVERGIKIIDRNSEEMVYVTGLMGLCAINPAGSTMDDGGKYVFANFCSTLKELIDEKV